MKIDILANTSDEPRGSTDATSKSSSLSGESSDGDNMELTGDIEVIQELKQKLASAEQNNKIYEKEIKLYEATIKDKNDLIELIKETKELMTKQLKDQISDLQKALNLSKNLTINKVDTNPAESAEFEKKTAENADFQRLQKQFDKSQSQISTLADNISQLKAEIAELKSMMGEKDDEMEDLKAKHKSQEDKLKAKIAELENKAKIDATKLKEIESSKFTSNGFESKDDSIILLNHSKVPNIKLIQNDIAPFTAIFEDIPFASPDWMVILTRFDGTINFPSFYLHTSEGQVNGEYFLGVELIHNLTSSRRHELYIELVDFDDVKVYARYDNFVVGSQKEGYALKSLGAYSGNAGDALRNHVNSKWGTKELWDNISTAWWFSDNLPSQCCLTGRYTKSKEEVSWADGIYWGNWYLGKRYSLKSCKMLIRPKL